MTAVQAWLQTRRQMVTVRSIRRPRAPAGPPRPRPAALALGRIPGKTEIAQSSMHHRDLKKYGGCGDSAHDSAPAVLQRVLEAANGTEAEVIAVQLCLRHPSKRAGHQLCARCPPEQTKEQSGGTQKKLDRENRDKMTLL